MARKAWIEPHSHIPWLSQINDFVKDIKYDYVPEESTNDIKLHPALEFVEITGGCGDEFPV